MTQVAPIRSLLPTQNIDVVFEDVTAATLGLCSNKLGTQDSGVGDGASPGRADHVQPV